MSYEFRSVPRIVCEEGALHSVGKVLKDLGAQRVMLVCDPGIVSLGFAVEAQDSLEVAGCAVTVFDQVVPDPSSAVVKEAAEAQHAIGLELSGLLGGLFDHGG